MSTPERAREHIAAARTALLNRDTFDRQELARVKLKLASWEPLAQSSFRDARRSCAVWLWGAGMLADALTALTRYLAVDSQPIYTAQGSIQFEIDGALEAAERDVDEWAADSADEEPDEEPESARDRVGGKLRQAALLRSCGCLDEIQIATCADDVWRETLARESAKPCARHWAAAERDRMTDEQRAAEHARTLEVLSDEWETTR